MGQVQAQDGPTGERQRVAAERAAVQARFTEQEAACQQRFAVTDCVNAAKKERRDALAPLIRLDASLDDVQRKQRAAQRREDIARKQQETLAREREVVVRTPPFAAPGLASSPAPLPAASAEASSVPSQALRQAKQKAPPKPQSTRLRPQRPNDAERRAREADAQARAAARKQAAKDHQEATELRNAQRAVRGKRADPLPAPPAASGGLP